MLGTVADLEAYQVVTTPARVAAADRAEQIRLGLQSTAVLYAKAVDEEDWRVLGYRSVADWAAKEFGPDRFSAERRKEIVALLTDAGLTVRQIAKAAGAGKSTVARDQREAGSVPSGTPGYDGGIMLVSDNQQVSTNQSPRQQAARDREAAARDREAAARDRRDEEAMRREWDDANTSPHTPGNVELVSVSLGMEENPFVAAARDREEARLAHCRKDVHLLHPVGECPHDQHPAVGAKADSPRRLGEADIEVIIADDLTRGQIRDRFGVGEHAAQLARVTAVAVHRERLRQATVSMGLSPELIALLRERAEAWLAYREGQRGSSLGTDRTKVTLFLDWLAAQ